MAATVTKVSICNLAMGWLRANLIMDLENDESKEAKLCNANYDAVREIVLEEREWRFATSRARLALSSEAPPFGWKFQFKLPSYCIRALSVSKSPFFGQITDNNVEWEVEEDFVMMDFTECFLRYTRNIEDTTKFSPSFVQCLATRLAAELAVSLTGSNTRQEELFAAYRVKMQIGGTKEGMQGKARRRRPGRLETARRRSGEWAGSSI